MPLPALSFVIAQTDAEGAGIGDAVGDAVGSAFSYVEALPIEAHAAAAIMLLVGLGLWLFGGKVLKTLFGIAGLVLGGMVGMIALPATGSETILGQPATVVGAGIGAIIGLVVALMALRLAIVVIASLGFAAAGFLGGAVYLSHNPLPDDAPPAAFEVDDSDRSPDGRLLFTNPYTGEKMTIDELTRTLREANSFLGGAKRARDGDPAEASGDDESPQGFDEERLRAIAVRCQAIVREGYDLAKSHWNALSMRERVVVAGSTFGGLALGMFIGFFMPRKATAVITALAGSAIWLTAAGLLLEAFVPSMRGLTDQPPTIWAFVWAFTFLLGFAIQLMGLGGPAKEKPKKKKAAEDEDEEDEEEE